MIRVSLEMTETDFKDFIRWKTEKRIVTERENLLKKQLDELARLVLDTVEQPTKINETFRISTQDEAKVLIEAAYKARYQI